MSGGDWSTVRIASSALRAAEASKPQLVNDRSSRSRIRCSSSTINTCGSGCRWGAPMRIDVLQKSYSSRTAFSSASTASLVRTGRSRGMLTWRARPALPLPLASAALPLAPGL